MDASSAKAIKKERSPKRQGNTFRGEATHICENGVMILGTERFNWRWGGGWRKVEVG